MKNPKSKDRKQPNRNRPTKHITFAPETLALIEAYQSFKVSTGDQKPDRTWMIEQGLQLFFQSMKEKSADCKTFLEKVEAELQARKQAPLLSLTKAPEKNVGKGTVGEN